MIAVNIDTQPFIQIITRLNEMLKMHETKFVELDKTISNLCTKSEFHEATDPLVSSINDLSVRSQDALKQSEKLTKEAIETREKMTELVNTKFDEMLVTTQLNQKNNSENLESKIDSVMQTAKQAIVMSREAKNECAQQEAMYKESKSNIQILGERIHHVNTEFIKFVNSQKGPNARPIVRVVSQGNNEGQPIVMSSADNSQLIEELEAKTKEQIDAVQSSVADLLNDRLTSLQKALEVAVMHPTSDSSPKLNEVWAVTSQNRAGLLNAMTEQSLLGRRVDVLQQMIDNIQQHSSNPESPNRPVLSSIMAHQNAANRAGVQLPLDNDIRAKEQTKLASTVDQLGGKMEGALQDILRIKNAVNRNEKDVRDVVLAIIDEFKLIRTNASGLEHLPPLNLATCVPSFFNNPSFTFDRNDSGSESPSDTDRSDLEGNVRRGRSHHGKREKKDENYSGQNSSQRPPSPVYHTKKVSGLLHLVSRPEPRIHDIPSVSECKPEPVEVEVEQEKHSARSTLSNTTVKSETQNPDLTPKVSNSPRRVVQNVVHVYDRQGLEELKSSMVEFHKEKDELMSAVDRKVDRVIVEKLFDKFRVIVSGINSRVEELAEEFGKLPKESDVQILSDLVQKTAEKVNNIPNPSSIPVHTFGDKGDFVMGEDGGAFIRASSTQKNQSELPPLKEKKKI